MSEEKRETKQALLGELESIKDLLSEDEWDDIPVLSDAVSAPASPPSTAEFSTAVPTAPLSEGAARSGTLTSENSTADEASVTESQLHEPLTQLDDRTAGEPTSNVNSDINDTDGVEENRATNVDHQLDLMAAVNEQTETNIAIGESAFADNSSETLPPQVPTSGISETHNSDIDAAVDKLNLDLSVHFDETEFDSQDFATEDFEPVEFETTDFVDGAFNSSNFADANLVNDDFTADSLSDEKALAENTLSASDVERGFSDANPQESDLAKSDLDNTPSEDDFSEYERSQAVDGSEHPDFDTDQTDLAEDALLAENNAAQQLEDSDQALEQSSENPFGQNINDSEPTELQTDASEAFTADELLETSDDDEEPLDSEKLDDDFLAEHVDEIEEELEHDLEELIHDLDALDSDAEMVDVVAFEMPTDATPEAATNTGAEAVTAVETVTIETATAETTAVNQTTETDHNLETVESGEGCDTAETPIEIDSVANEAPNAIDEYQHDAFAELSPSDASNSSLFSSLSQDYDSSSTDSDSDSNIEPLLDFTDQQIHTDENGNPLPPGVLPGQQSLFSGAQVKNGTADQNNHPEEKGTHENDAEGYVRPQRPTRATGENPFLPKHIRDRLHTEKTLVDIIKESPLPPPAAARPLSDHVHEAVKEQLPPQLSSESLHHVVEEVIALYMPRIEAELRERLLNEIRRMEPEENEEGEDEVLGEATEEILDSQIEREIEDDETL